MVQTNRRYVDLMSNWTKNLFKPEEVERQPGEIHKISNGAAITTSVVVATILGRNASFIDKAAYVAYPFAVEAAARLGAQRGNGEPRN